MTAGRKRLENPIVRLNPFLEGKKILTTQVVENHSRSHNACDVTVVAAPTKVDE